MGLTRLKLAILERLTEEKIERLRETIVVDNTEHHRRCFNVELNQQFNFQT
jgi:hypothetical protein